MIPIRLWKSRFEDSWRRATWPLSRAPDRFLGSVRGVIHVGANTGQERRLYEKYGLRVLWAEPNPEAFEVLERNIQPHRRQRALRCLVTDRDDAEYQFHIANNLGLSSSILEFKLHRDIWPQVAYDKSIALRSVTLETMLRKAGVDHGDYDCLVLDTQGSELLVLKGAAPILSGFRFIKTEVPDFESYQGCCQLRDINSFLAGFGFREFSRHKFAERQEGGCYYDVVYRQTSRPRRR